MTPGVSSWSRTAGLLIHLHKSLMLTAILLMHIQIIWIWMDIVKLCLLGQGSLLQEQEITMSVKMLENISV
ncbi:hypothetical protein LINPERHAP2_LOCUS34471 [Linum perenne]